MKSKILRLLLLPALAGAALAQQHQGQAFVRVTDLFTQGTTIIGVQSVNQGFAMDIGKKGAVFELFATDAWGQNLTLVDTKTVNVYTPQASLVLQSQDPYIRGDIASLSSVRRTRADRPFTLSVGISGFVSSGSNRMEYQTNRIRYSLATYCALESQPPGFAPAANPNIGNTSWSVVEAPDLNLAGEDPRYACGEHTFAIYWADPAFDAVGGGIFMAKCAIEVWPMSLATIEGLSEGRTYVDRLPTVTVDCRHLYPDSRTYARIYKGPRSNDAQADPIAGTERQFGEFYVSGELAPVVPQNYSVAIDDLSRHTPEDGVYTLEVVTHTPFARNGERLAHVTFEVDRIISTRGQLSTRE